MGTEIISIIPLILGFGAVATVGGTFLVWLLWLSARAWGPLSKPASSRFPLGATVAVLLALSLPAGCIWAAQPVRQPESQRTVAAYEVPVPSARDRADLLAILAAEARAEGLEVNVEPAGDLKRWAEVSPDLRSSIYATVYRNGDPRQIEAEASDRFHLGHVWLVFFRGDDPALARRFHERLMVAVIERWPESLSVPVAETGALPFREHLVRGEKGYEIDPAKLAGYDCGTAPGNAPRSACE